MLTPSIAKLWRFVSSKCFWAAFARFTAEAILFAPVANAPTAESEENIGT